MLQTILSYAAFLVCPLIMLFCMKGMFSGGNKSSSTENSKQPRFSSKREELDYIRGQMTDLQARFERLSADNDRTNLPTEIPREEKIQQG